MNLQLSKVGKKATHVVCNMEVYNNFSEETSVLHVIVVNINQPKLFLRPFLWTSTAQDPEQPQWVSFSQTSQPTYTLVS